MLNDWVNPKKKTSAQSAQSFRRNLFIKTYRFAMIKQINRICYFQLRTLRKKTSAPSAQSFHRNLFIKTYRFSLPSRRPRCSFSAICAKCTLLSHLSFSVASRSAKLQTRDCKIASTRKNPCHYVSFFKKYSRCHMKKRYLCQLLSTGACA